MSDENGTTPAGPAADERLIARARIRHLSWTALRRIVRLSWRLMAAAAVGGLAGAAAHWGLESWPTASAIGIGVTLIALAMAALPLRDPQLRAAQEVYADHLQLERTEWKQVTGTKLPSRFSQAERWLREHPDAEHGRAALLIGVGRFAEAEAALAARPPATATDVYDQELIRQQGRLFAGERPDLAVLRRDLATLPDAIRRHRRQCLAMLEAQATVDGGGDPIAPLAAGRDPRGPVYARSRWFVNPLAWLAIAQLPSWISLVVHAFG